MDNLSCRSIFSFFISESFSRRSFGVPSGLLWSAFDGAVACPFALGISRRADHHGAIQASC
jgi:hypothetical protein